MDIDHSPCLDCWNVDQDKNKLPCAVCPLPQMYADAIHLYYWKSEGIVVQYLVDSMVKKTVE